MCEETVSASLPSGHQTVYTSFVFVLSRPQMFDPPTCQPFSFGVCQRPARLLIPRRLRRKSGVHIWDGPSAVCRDVTAAVKPSPSSHIWNPDSRRRRALTADYKRAWRDLCNPDGRRRHWRHFGDVLIVLPNVKLHLPVVKCSCRVLHRLCMHPFLCFYARRRSLT